MTKQDTVIAIFIILFMIVCIKIVIIIFITIFRIIFTIMARRRRLMARAFKQGFSSRTAKAISIYRPAWPRFIAPALNAGRA